ncbi:MAG: hypothetical protein H6970_01020 [Gammaproteobacteria bacterium]|nr:hypothetical protein [Gammaproteobacteria bacterium]MCP5423639.1 hypothetical protein [Gammaproteobacteria bacterium]MCP5459892.1 hypothetical protein [Gammaproteobacteria bacterium]
MTGHRHAALLLLAVLAAWSLLLGLALWQLRLNDEQAGKVVVLFPPAWDAQTHFERTLRAGGLVVGQAPLANLWVVYSEQAGFVGRLKDQGAWIAFQPAPFAIVTLGGCFSGPGALPPSFLKTRRLSGDRP